jgi:hypothetical protein
MQAYEACFPRALFDYNLDEFPRFSNQDLCNGFEAENRLKSDFYLAVTTGGLPNEYRIIPGANNDITEDRSKLTLVFERRVANRFAIEFCPTLTWDRIEVNIGSYQLGDVLGQGIVDEVWHPPIVAATNESIESVIERAVSAAQDLARDLTGWVTAARFMKAGQQGRPTRLG